MKKILLSFVALVGMIATACISEDTSSVAVAENEGVVTFSLQTPTLESRAEATIGKGLLATELQYAIYDADWTLLEMKETTLTGSPLSTTLNIRLVKNKTYNFVFWAQTPNNSYYTTNFGIVGESSTPTVAVNYASASNDDARDAFFGQELNLVVDGAVNKTVFLTRPFAQINFGASDADIATKMGFDVAHATTSFQVSAYNTLYLASGAVDGLSDVVFTAGSIPTESLTTLSGDTYTWLAMNYILAPANEASLSTCSMTIVDPANQTISVDVPQAPSKRNYRTNLVGKVLTDAASIKVEIVPAFEDEFQIIDSAAITNNYIEAVLEVETDGQKVYFRTDIAQNSNPLVGINYGDGTYGIDREHIYNKAGEYTIRYYFNEPITEIKGNAFWGVLHNSITIPKTVTAIGNMAFGYSHLLRSVKFEQGSQLKTIGNAAFVYCSKLESLTIPASVESIGTCVFGGCKSLKSVYSGGSKFRNDFRLLTEWTDNYHYIVYVCPSAWNVENVQIGGATTTIRWGAFTYCNIIKNVDIWITDIEQVNFIYCDNLESIDLDRTTSIANDVLHDCKSLKSLDMPLVKEIGTSSLCNNASLAYISFGCNELAKLKEVGSNCAKLNELWIPSGVTEISNSFNGCPALAEVYCKATTPPTLESSFDSLSADAKIYVPTSSTDIYKAAWVEYAANIEPYEFY